MAISTSELTPLSAKTGPTGAAKTAEPSFGFGDVLDAINPLQQLPGVGIVYRAITGDEISAPARILGGALFGGPLGMLGAALYTVAEQIMGADPEEAALAQIGVGGEDTAADEGGGVEQIAVSDVRPETVDDAPPQQDIPQEATRESGIPVLNMSDLPLVDLFVPTLAIPGRSADTEAALARLADDVRQGAVLGGSVNLSTQDAATTMAQANIDQSTLLGTQPKSTRENQSAAQQHTRTQSQAAMKAVDAQAAIKAAETKTAQDGNLGTPVAIAPEAMPEAMMQGLQKYQAMLRARQAEATQGASRAA
jgi:hypothetical protein